MSKEYTWHDVVIECEKILDCEDTAESPLTSNLPNLIRDLKIRLEKEFQISDFLREQNADLVKAIEKLKATQCNEVTCICIGGTVDFDCPACYPK